MAELAKVRLLICFVCKSIEEVPWYEGPSEYDDTLEYRASAHAFPSGERHVGHLFVVQKQDWENSQARAAIIRDISLKAPGDGDGLGQQFYDVKSTFMEDAQTCWKQHGKRVNCEDYMSDRKKLLPDTKADRKAEGLDPKTRPATFLCQFCPVNSVMMQRRREAKGMYDKQSWE